MNAKPNRQKIIRKEVVAMFKFLCKAAGMVAVTALILRLGEAVSNRAVSNVFSRLAGVVKARWNRLWA